MSEQITVLGEAERLFGKKYTPGGNGSYTANELMEAVKSVKRKNRTLYIPGVEL